MKTLKKLRFSRSLIVIKSKGWPHVIPNQLISSITALLLISTAKCKFMQIIEHFLFDTEHVVNISILVRLSSLFPPLYQYIIFSTSSMIHQTQSYY